MALVREADCYTTLNLVCERCTIFGPGRKLNLEGTDSRGFKCLAIVAVACIPDEREFKAKVTFSPSVNTKLADQILDQTPCCLVRR